MLALSHHVGVCREKMDLFNEHLNGVGMTRVSIEPSCWCL